jgi:phosphatidylinositol-3-phosphatase
MDGPPSSDAPDGGENDPTPPEGSELREAPEHDRQEGGFPTPSPWAIAFAVVALLAFGVGLGVWTRPQESAPALLASAPSPASTGTSTTSTSTSTSGSETEAGSEPEEESEEGASEEESAGGAEEGSSGKESSSAGNGTKEKESEESGSKGSEPEEESSGKGSQGNGSQGNGSGSKAAASTLPPIKHVFVIVLGEQGYQAAFGASSQAPYLASTLRRQGELIDDYYAVTSGQLANEIALISGQGPTPQTLTGCPTYEQLSPGKSGSEGQSLGAGCLYPISALTVGGQLVAAGDTWKAYVQGLGEGSSASLQGKCPSPAVGASDPYSTASTSSPFVTWRDPFLYFDSVTSSSNCAEENVGIGELSKDLEAANTTPSLSYIAPDPCEDGDPAGCGSGSPAGLPTAEGFLKKVVPEIESSAAYKEGGMIAIAFDQAPQSGTGADDSGCCATPKYPNLPAGTPTTTATGQPVGGGHVGMLLLSKYVKPGSSYVTGQYNHFSLLASVEALFKLQPLGYAGNVQLPSFEKAVYNAYS